MLTKTVAIASENEVIQSLAWCLGIGDEYVLFIEKLVITLANKNCRCIIYLIDFFKERD